MTDNDFNTLTMAKLYADQGYYVEAADVYRFLLKQSPGDKELEKALADVEAQIEPPEPQPFGAVENEQFEEKANLEKLFEQFSDWLIRYRRVRDLHRIKQKLVK